MSKASFTPSALKRFGMGPPWRQSTWGYRGFIAEVNWTCDHHHRDPGQAERCAKDEIRRREASGT
jgi:hypothetical protein